jgi:homoserine O-succinyltransferase/O-acetyltransferase
MPIEMEQGASGRSFLLLAGVRLAHPKIPMRRDGVEIGIVNNMPDAALESTERQFIGLLAAASERTPVRVRLFSLPGIPRGDFARRYVAGHYAGIEDLWKAPLDGLIVTGTEPRRAALTDEPYWGDFTKIVDWAERNTVSTIWSCLAAHAAVLHLDAVDRCALADKCFGIFQSERTVDHALMATAPAALQVPHSRWNGLPENALTACGYDVLSRGADIGADMFVKQFRSLFVFLQGHPEYEASTLLREYRRDVGRFLRRERETFPAQPQRYFDQASAQALDVFRTRALVNRSEDLLESFPAAAIREPLFNSSRASALRLFRNWLTFISARREATFRAIATATPELGSERPSGVHIPNRAVSV